MFWVFFFRRNDVRSDVHTYSIQTGTGRSSAPLCCGYWPSLRPLCDRQTMHPSKSSFCSSPSNNSSLRREPSDWSRNWAALGLHTETQTRKRHTTLSPKQNVTERIFFSLVFSIYMAVGEACSRPLCGTCNQIFCCSRCSPTWRLFQCL